MNVLSPTAAIAAPSPAVVTNAVPVKHLRFQWGPRVQRLVCDDRVSEFQGTPTTEPSHDLAHLMIAACGNLPWQPEGPREIVCMAEYNAVLLENLFDKTCNVVVFGTTSDPHTLAAAIVHMEWFVNQHYAPFPISAEAALQQFCRFIDPFVVSRLFPYYLVVKRYERTHMDYRQAEYQLQFTSQDQPTVDEAGWLAQWSIYRQLKAAQSAMGLVSAPQEFRVEQILKQLDQLPLDRPQAVAASASPADCHPAAAITRRLTAIEAQLTQIDQLKQRLTALEALPSNIRYHHRWTERGYPASRPILLRSQTELENLGKNVLGRL
ncbi:hypothetical protein [Trichothermofontia sp.]